VALKNKKSTVASSRKIRKELSGELDKLHGLVGVWRMPVVGQHSAEGALDDVSARVLARQIREQAEVCLNLLDQYQASVPGPMWSDAERKCVPLREDLKQTEKLFRAASGEWEGRLTGRT
jgi:hypothetical protein